MKQREFFLVIISAFVITVIWIASNIYNSHATSTIDPVLQVQTIPIAPTFDMATFNALKNRTVVQPAAVSIVAITEDVEEVNTESELTPDIPIEESIETIDLIPTPEDQQSIITITPIPTLLP